MMITTKPKQDFNPPAIIDSINLDHGQIYVAREDLLPGGTKQRAIIPFLIELKNKGYKSFLYASPFSGFAQVALSFACAVLNLECILFCEKFKENKPHEFTKLAQSYGAKVLLYDNLEQATLMSESISNLKPNSYLLPLGFNHPSFKENMKLTLEKEWFRINKQYNFQQLWLPVGSGTLYQSFKSFIDMSVEIFVVNVNVLPENDLRIKSIIEDERCHYIKSPYCFHDQSKDKTCKVPSNLYYDLKVFEILKDSDISKRALWWNVAR